MENNDIHKELQDLNSPLAKMEKKNPFEVPVNYFEEMPQSVQSYIYDRKKMPSVFALPNFWIRWTPAFTLVLVFFGIVAYMLSPKNASVQNPLANTQNPVIQQQISTTEYLLDNVDEDLLVETYQQKQQNVTITKAVSVENTQKKNTDIEEYILDNYDESALIEEL